MKWRILFFLASVVVIGSILEKNPTLLTSDLLLGKIPMEKITVPADFTYLELKNKTVSSMYRVHPHRNAQSDSFIRLPVKYRKQFDSLNRGIHGASKSSPAIDETGIYIGSDLGWMTAIDHQGKLKWRFKVKDSKNGIHSTALLNSKEIIFGAYNGRLYSLDKENGFVNWVIRLGEVIGSSPVQDKNGDIYISVETNTPADGYLVKLNAFGRILWKSELAGDQAHSSPALSSDESIVLYGANNGFLIAIDTKSGEAIWRYQSLGPIKSTPVIMDERVIFTDRGRGGLTCLNLKDGKLLWSKEIGLEGAHSSPVVISELDSVLVVSSIGRLYSISLLSGKVLWEKDISSRPYKMSPSAFHTVVNMKKEWSLLVFCEEDKLCFFSVAKGQLLQKIPVNAKLTGEVAFYRDRLYFSLDHPGDVGVLESQSLN